MDGIGYAEAFAGLALASAMCWGAIFGFAYSRRRFGGSARGYLAGFALAWAVTVACFVLLTILEA